MKKIVILTQQYKTIRSGVGFYSRNLIEGLRERGYKVTVFCPEKEGIKEDDNQILLKCPSWDLTPGRWFSLSYRFASKIKDSEYNDCDIIHFTDAREALFFEDFEGKALGTVHDSYNLRVPRNPLALKENYRDWMIRWIYGKILSLLENKTYPGLDKIITNSDFVGKDLLTLLNLDKNKIRKIYYGLPSRNKNIQRLEDDAVRLLFVGGNFQRKGLPDLLAVMEKLKSEFPGLHLDVIGSNRSLSRMKKLVNRKNLSDSVTFHGNVDHDALDTFYQKASLFVMPSLIEAFGIVYLEAMSYGVPVIATKKGGTKELVRNGQDGFLITPGDQKELLARIKELLTSKEKRERFSKNARERSNDFNASGMIDKTIEVYRSMK